MNIFQENNNGFIRTLDSISMQRIFTEFPELTSTNNTWVLAILLRSEHLTNMSIRPELTTASRTTEFVKNAQYPASLEARL